MKLLKKICVMLIIILILLGATLTGLGYNEYRTAINKSSLEDKVEAIKGQENYITFDEINSDLLKATVAIEDRRFYEHDGVDYFALVRTLLSNALAGEIVGGGSTITQQTAKNLYFGYHPSIIRKIAEVFMAKDLEKNYSKKEILELYVNIINYGDNHIGIKEASNGYFRCEPIDLNLNQSSLLAGIPQSPANFQLSNHEEQARIRQKAVLEAMVKEKDINYVQSMQVQGNQ
ncbi:MAG: biosynthetic peptidoglycan transglycosylase [Erysipelotrichaceae bacterium]